jgi:hypothetical protein
MPDLGLHPATGDLVAMVLVHALPWLIGGGVIGGVIWHVGFRRAWWVGILAGAVLGAAAGFAITGPSA